MSLCNFNVYKLNFYKFHMQIRNFKVPPSTEATKHMFSINRNFWSGAIYCRRHA